VADYGLRNRAFKPSRRWAVDNLDYARTLPPEEKAWLEKFNREFYDGDFRGVDPLHASDDLRRSCYSAQNAAYRDVMSRGAVRLEEDAWLERKVNSTVNVWTRWSESGEEMVAAQLGDQLSFRF
jgi:hypothetical protein